MGNPISVSITTPAGITRSAGMGSYLSLAEVANLLTVLDGVLGGGGISVNFSASGITATQTGQLFNNDVQNMLEEISKKMLLPSFGPDIEFTTELGWGTFIQCLHTSHGLVDGDIVAVHTNHRHGLYTIGAATVNTFGFMYVDYIPGEVGYCCKRSPVTAGHVLTGNGFDLPTFQAPSTVATSLSLPVHNNITAASGVTIANFFNKATLCTGIINVVSTCAVAGDSIRLPNCVAGSMVVVINKGAQNLYIWPNNVDDDCTGGYYPTWPFGTLPSTKVMIYFAIDGKYWQPLPGE